jgi:hypothetical protein
MQRSVELSRGIIFKSYLFITLIPLSVFIQELIVEFHLERMHLESVNISGSFAHSIDLFMSGN